MRWATDFWWPSQFYWDLKKLASPSTLDDFILTLWRIQLPACIRRILAVADDSNAEKFTRAADRIEEAYWESYQRTSWITAVTDPPAQNVGARIASYNALNEQLIQLQTQITALSFGSDRPSRRRSRCHVIFKVNAQDSLWNQVYFSQLGFLLQKIGRRTVRIWLVPSRKKARCGCALLNSKRGFVVRTFR
jgi:hypothetical protein